MLPAAAGVRALSRYVLPGGGVEWAACEVLGHEPDENLFQIRWRDHGGEKLVSRSNLRLPGEEPGGVAALGAARRVAVAPQPRGCVWSKDRDGGDCV